MVVVAVSSKADARRSDPVQPVVAGAPSAGTRAPRPWAAPLPRPAARILLAGGLTLAGWLLGAALSNAGASADELPACSQPDTVAAKQAHAVKPHHRKHRDIAAPDACAKPVTAETTTARTNPAETPPADETPPAEADEATPLAAPSTSSAKKQKTTKTSSAGLLGGLLDGVLEVVGSTLQAVTSTVGTVGHAVTDPLTQPPADNPAAPPILPIGGIIDPVLDGVSGSGGVTVTVPTSTEEGVVTTTSAAGAVTAIVPDAAAATPAQAGTRATAGASPHITLIPRQRELPAQVDPPRDSGVHARTGGGGDTPGLPSSPSAPSAPASSVSSGHDGPGGARQPFAVHTDGITTTQLRLAGTNRDHAADHAGREAALPTTSPD